MKKEGFIFLIFILTLLGCQREVVKFPDLALKRVQPPKVWDDLEAPKLAHQLREHAHFLLSVKEHPDFFFEGIRIEKETYAKSLLYLAKQLLSPQAPPIESVVRKDFDFYAVYGNQDWSEIFLTSYFEPEITGSLFRTPKYSEPLLAIPSDLLTVDVESYDERFKNIRRMRGRVDAQKSPTGLTQILPYWSRQEIAQKQLWKRKGLVFCWVDPLDAFFLQIQGSGRILIDSGQVVRLGYGEQNGHPYVAVGKFLTDSIPIEEMSLERIESHLRTLTHEQQVALLNQNPSYVFFKKLDSAPLTTLGSPVIEGRTIATDEKIFAKGGVGFLKFQAPSVDNPLPDDPSHWKPSSRLVFDQDTGGAIRGPGRVDLFWGRGEEAKKIAGAIKQEAQLFYIAPKADLLAQLKQDKTRD